MTYIGIGILGFLAMNVFDMVSLKRAPFGIKPALWVLGCAALIYSIVMLCFKTNTLPVSNFFRWLGWGLLAVSLFMITLALFVNLPFRKTYVESGVGDKLVKTGLYALVRHPGVYWVGIFFFSFVFISRSVMMLAGAVIFTSLNTLFVVIEDKYFFVKMFPGYDQYKKETPMLVPNRRSIKAFMNSIKKDRTQA